MMAAPVLDFVAETRVAVETAAKLVAHVKWVVAAAVVVALADPLEKDDLAGAGDETDGWNSCTGDDADGAEVLAMKEGDAVVAFESPEEDHSVQEECPDEEVALQAALAVARLEAHEDGLVVEDRSSSGEAVGHVLDWDWTRPPTPGSRDYCATFAGTGSIHKPCLSTGTRRYTGLGEYSHQASINKRQS